MTKSSYNQMWQPVKLGNVCSIRGESAHPLDNPDALYVGLEHIDSGNSRLARYGIASEVNSSKSKFRKGDILYGKLRPYLDKAVLAEFDGICSTDILVFKTSGNQSNEFLIQLIHSNRFLEHAKKTTKGVNHPRTSWAALSDFEFQLPNLSEQFAIAQILQAIEEAKETRRRELDLERERKAALMQHLFTHGTRGEKTKQTEIGEMPQDWQIVKLGEIFHTQLGKMLSQKAKVSETPKPYMRNANIQWARVDCSQVYTMDFNEKESVKFNLKYGDILVCEGGEVGRTAIWRDEIEECYFQKAIHRLRSINNNIISEFFLYWMELAFKLKNLYGIAGTQTTIAHLPQDKLQAMKIPLPHIEEQRQITEVLICSDNKIEALETEVERLDELFKAMLEELMTGTLSALPLVN